MTDQRHVKWYSRWQDALDDSWRGVTDWHIQQRLRAIRALVASRDWKDVGPLAKRLVAHQEPVSLFRAKRSIYLAKAEPDRRKRHLIEAAAVLVAILIVRNRKRIQLSRRLPGLRSTFRVKRRLEHKKQAGRED